VLRVCHSGDWHVPETGRFVDTLRCLDAMIDDGIAQGTGLWLVGGDLGGTTVPYRHPPKVRNAIADRLQRQAAVAPVLVIGGNHDVDEDIAIYGRLKAAHPIVVVTDVRMVEIAGAAILCFPYPWKNRWVAPHAHLPIEEQDRAIEADLRKLLDGWATEVAIARAAGIPTVFLGHVTIGGCAIAGGEVMPPGREISLATADLEALGCDFSALSHIHLCQEMKAGSGIWYAGSPDRSNFGEHDEKGFLIADVESGRPPLVHRRLTPARPFVTIRAAWKQDADGAWAWESANPAVHVDVSTAEVRLQIEVPEEAAGTCPVGELVETLKEAGAHEVKIDRRVIPKTRIRSEAIVTAKTTAEKCAAYWSTLGPAAPTDEQRERALVKLAELETPTPVRAEEAAA